MNATPPGEVLIIDDEPVIRRIIARLLGPGLVTSAPETAIDAIALIRSGRRFDVIVCDLMMPDLTGMDVYDAVVEVDPDQARRMVFVSGGTYDPRALAFMKSVANPRLDKPFRPDELRRLVDTIIASIGRIPRS